MSILSPEEIVREVLDRVHASDERVGELYAEDAVRYGHDGRVMQGRAEIAVFYRSIFPTSAPHPELESLLVNPPYVAALIRLPGHEDAPVRYVDLFEIRDGAIQSLRVLMPPALFGPRG
jgi:hypothetical protein